MKKRRFFGLFALLFSMGISGCTLGDGGSTKKDDEPIGELTWVGTKENHYQVDSKGSRVGEPEPHTLVDSEGDKDHVPMPPTCTKPGKGFQQCSICKKFIEVVVAPLDHNWVNQATGEGAATCTEPGVIDWGCSRCDATKQETGAKALGHLCTPVATSVEGILKGECTRPGCTGGEIILDVSNASGWNNATTKMDGKTSPNNQSTWNVAGIVDDGVYDIQIEGLMSYSSHGVRKWYNMSKANLCIDNQVEETATSNPDSTGQDDYRYYFKVNNLCGELMLWKIKSQF